ncbi:MAG: hypothetical protein RI922_2842 [Bacteroidota bacterium]
MKNLPERRASKRYQNLHNLYMKSQNKIVSLLSFTFMLCWFSFGQKNDTIRYSALFIDCCSNDIGNFYQKTDWYVIDEKGERYNPKNDTVSLPVNGNYSIISFAYQSEPIKLNLTSDIHVDTFKTSCLNSYLPELFYSKNSTFVSCSNFTDSIYTEYHTNGNLRWKGNFSNGMVVNCLENYYFTGELKSKLLIDENSVLYYEFYSTGQLKTEINTKKKYRKYYYPNGEVSMKMTNFGKLKFFTYFENGNIKVKQSNRKEIIYSEQGTVSQELSRKSLFINDRMKSADSSISYTNTWIKYDSIGNKVKELEFISKNHYSIVTGTIYKIRKNEYKYIEYYKNGEKAIAIYLDFYTDEKGEYIMSYYLSEYENGKFKTFKELPVDEYELLIQEYEK